MKKFWYIVIALGVAIVGLAIWRAAARNDNKQECTAVETEESDWTRICAYDLSKSVIDADSAPTDGMFSWWSDKAIEEWESYGNEVEEDQWLKLNTAPLGFRGSDYQRFEIFFNNVHKESTTKYMAEGTTRCQGVTLPFRGWIEMDSFAIDTAGYRALDIEEENFLKEPALEGTIYGHYSFDVYDGETKVARMEGRVTYDILEYGGQIYYNALMIIADGYCNNQYEGKWTDLKTGENQTCNWGDYRIPGSQDLDIGAGEFFPAEQYRHNGWNDFFKQYE